MGVTVLLTATVVTRYSTCMCRKKHTQTHTHSHTDLRIFTLIYPLDSITFLIHQAGLILQPAVVVFVTSRSTLICEGNTCNTAPRGKPPVLN